MAITPADVEGMLTEVAARVETTDWTDWEADPNDERLTSRVTQDKPPLTRWMVLNYLSFYAWVWQRVPPPEEVEQLTDLLVSEWSTAFVRMDYAFLNGILATLTLWAEISERPEEEQEAIRSVLQDRIPAGAYPELETERAPTASGPADTTVADAVATSRMTAVAVSGALNQMVGVQAPPRFLPT